MTMKGTMSDWLPRAMAERGWDAKTVAQKSGLSLGTIYHLQNGTREPSLETCNRLARVFGLHPVELQIALGLVPALPESSPHLFDETERAIVDGVLRASLQDQRILLRIVNLMTGKK